MKRARETDGDADVTVLKRPRGSNIAAVLSDLPLDVMVHVLTWLRGSDVANTALSCRSGRLASLELYAHTFAAYEKAGFIDPIVRERTAAATDPRALAPILRDVVFRPDRTARLLGRDVRHWLAQRGEATTFIRARTITPLVVDLHTYCFANPSTPAPVENYETFALRVVAKDVPPGEEVELEGSNGVVLAHCPDTHGWGVVLVSGPAMRADAPSPMVLYAAWNANTHTMFWTAECTYAARAALGRATAHTMRPRNPHLRLHPDRARTRLRERERDREPATLAARVRECAQM